MTVNLCFHGIGTPARDLEVGEAAYWVTPSFFRTTLDEVANRDDVCLSFDDGNRSDLEVALPELQARGLRATFFVLAGRLDLPGSLSADDVRGLAAAGMSIGSHGMLHVPWRGLDAAAQEREFGAAREELAAVVGSPVTCAALPLGRYDRVVLKALRARGYDAVYSSDRASARSSGQFLRPRYSLRSSDRLTDVRQMLAGQSRGAAVVSEAKMLAKARRGAPRPQVLE